MKLAINYSEAAESLVEEGKIRLDLFKCADEAWLVKKASRVIPATVHFNLQVGNQSLASTDWAAVHHLYQNTQTLYINVHLEPTVRNHPDIPLASGDSNYRDKIVARILEELQPVLKRYQAEQIIIENAIYRGIDGNIPRVAVEPEVFHRVMDKIDCSLLLDISHARISARSLGIDEREYISNLPIKRLREIHFTGLHNIDGKWMDHLPVLEEDWPILEWVLSEVKTGNFARPWLFVFEYGGIGDKYIDRSDPEVIATQLPHIRQLLQATIPSL